ncbi:MAG: mechanosensitive ion channel family protein [Phycisphaerae bacterium]
MRISVRSLTILSIFLLTTSASALSQDDAPEAEAAKSTGVTADPEVSLEWLEIQVRPLSKAETEAEVNAWIELLHDKAREISTTKIAAAKAEEGEERTKLIEKVSDLADERTALIDRVNVVLTSYAEKGGDRDEYDKYVRAVSQSKIDVTNVSAAWLYLKKWAVAENGGLRVARNIGLFLATLFVAWIVARLAAGLVRRGVNRLKRTSDLLRNFLVGIVFRAIMFVGLVIGLSFLEVPVAPLLTILGAAGLVVGLALQGTLSNFASGILILLYRPFDVGDAVEVGGVGGSVQSMTLLTTALSTWDNQAVVIPNNEVWGNVIKNFTGNTTRRVDMTFGIGYGDDIDQARKILEDIVTSHEKVLPDPAPVVRVHELADSSVNFVCRPWTRPADYWAVYWDVTEQVKKRFDAAGVSIPFPQRDVHLFRAAASSNGDEDSAG